MADSNELNEKLEIFHNNINVRITIKQQNPRLNSNPPQLHNTKKKQSSQIDSLTPVSRQTIRIGTRVKTLSKNIQLSEIDSKAIKEILNKKLPIKKFLTPTRPNFKIDLKSKTPIQSSSRMNTSYILAQKTKNSFKMIGEKILNLNKLPKIQLKNLNFNLNLNKFAGL